MAPYVMCFTRAGADPLLGPGNRDFLGSRKGIEPLGEFNLGPKKVEIPGPNPLPLAQVMDLHASYTLQGLINQCCRSMTFWGGSGSADPCLVLMDPDANPDPALFVIDLPKMPTKNYFF
jgi:hypothetical protein